ncbi:MAG: hypothetical protein AB7I42_23980 [Bradyrhizobium sp.]|uniref:hypothetical protein n=1 Tax=Bradyrhizobium sp. TaxID=376 RepID=UPI003D0ECA90
MSNLYAWQHAGASAPPAPIKPMFFLDSSTHLSALPAGKYGAVFSPGFQMQGGFQWWCDYLLGRTKNWDGAPQDPLGHLKRIGVEIDFVHSDIEWEENKLDFPYFDTRLVTDRFATIRTILKRFFPTQPICFYGDKWEVEEVAADGRITGRHLFFGWQNRDGRGVGSMPNYVNMFWNQTWAPERVLHLARTHHIIHWVSDAKVWMNVMNSDGTPVVEVVGGKQRFKLEPKDVEVETPALQRDYGVALANVKRPVMIYGARDWNSPNCRAFVEGVRAATAVTS